MVFLAPVKSERMKKKMPLFIMVVTIISCETTVNKKQIEVNYPITAKVDSTDTYFGTKVPDPYRWLEDDMSPQTASWVKEENKVTFDYLEEIPFRKSLKQRLEKLWNYEKISAPSREGNYTYFYKNDGLQNQSVLYRQENGSDTPEIFLDPNSFSEDGTTSLQQLNFTRDGSKVAYLISEGGSDWRKAVICEADSREILGDTLVDIKFSQIAWQGNSGFYYSSYDKPKGSELSAMTESHKVYYHKLGTPQSEDQIIFGGTAAQKHRYVFAGLTEDERFLWITASNSTSGNKLFLKDLSQADSPIITILDHSNTDSNILDNEGSLLYIETNKDAPNKKVVTVDASDPAPENWVDFIPETDQVLSPTIGGGFIFAEYMVDAISKIKQYDYKGKFIRELMLPGAGTADDIGGKKKDKEFYFTFTNYCTPTSIFKYDVNTGEYSQYWKPDIDFDPKAYESNQVFYTSKDGTQIPMIITHKKGLELNGKNPAILYGYGGFNISVTPTFSIVNAVWMEQGGIYAVPNIRGGGEYGKDWHNAGTKFNKQNVFDDFIAAAEYLIEKKYTTSEYLAISGGSNGGLLVGATMTQRPELMKVALPAVGVLDMLRYHTFTAGAGWGYDYGMSKDSVEMFNYLRSYSPLHNIKDGVHYPATLITTGDHDDRVVPAHSFKFAAELQAKQSGKNPALIRIETNAGHGAGTPVSKAIDLYSDRLGFTLYNMGFEKLPNEAVVKDFKE